MNPSWKLFYGAKLQILNDIHNVISALYAPTSLFYGAKLQILNDIHNRIKAVPFSVSLFYGAKLQILNDIHNNGQIIISVWKAVLWCKVTNLE